MNFNSNFVESFDTFIFKTVASNLELAPKNYVDFKSL
jgi:hypothetical protein